MQSRLAPNLVRDKFCQSKVAEVVIVTEVVAVVATPDVAGLSHLGAVAL